MKKWPNVNIQIESPSLIDEDVILGYPSGRLPKGGDVILGKNSKIRSGSVIYQSVRIGDNFESGHHVVIREDVRIGDGVWVWSNTIVDYSCVIGDRVRIHANSYVAQCTVIEDDVFIAPGVIFANDKYPVSTYLEGPHVKKGARIGVNVTILPGVVIGEEAFVGAGSVVTKNVPARTVVIGNPAHAAGTIDSINTKRELLSKRG